MIGSFYIQDTLAAFYSDCAMSLSLPLAASTAKFPLLRIS
jgi:hypothetical protein